MVKKKIIRVTTIPVSLKVLLKGQLRFINQYFDVIGVSSEGKELDDVARDEGVKTIPLNMSRQITPLKDIVSLIKMILCKFKARKNAIFNSCFFLELIYIYLAFFNFNIISFS